MNDEVISIKPFGNVYILCDPQSLLDSMGIKLVNPLGKEVKVPFLLNIYGTKKVEKELKRLVAIVHY